MPQTKISNKTQTKMEIEKDKTDGHATENITNNLTNATYTAWVTLYRSLLLYGFGPKAAGVNALHV